MHHHPTFLLDTTEGVIGARFIVLDVVYPKCFSRKFGAKNIFLSAQTLLAFDETKKCFFLNFFRKNISASLFLSS